MAEARLTVVKMLMKLEGSEAYSNLLLDHELDGTDLSGRDKAFAAALFYGVLERRLTLDFVIGKSSKIPFAKLDKAVVQILRTGIYQLMYMPSVPESAAVNESVKLCKRLKCFSAQGFVNGMLRGFIRSGKRADLSSLNPAERLSVEYSCPEALVRKLSDEYGEDFAAKALGASMGRPPVYARVNTLKTDTDTLLEELRKCGIKAEPFAGLSDCIVLDKSGDIEKCAPYRRGLFHVQDVSSQLCCLALSPKAGETVLDVCAAPGGKSFTLAELMENRGTLFSMDIHDMRVGLIEDGAERLGIKIIKAVQNDSSVYNDALPIADRVLCDVPCSGLGVIRRKPEIKYKPLEEFSGLPEIQYRILETSARYVKPGGTLVYSTCTLSRVENDDVAERFAAAHPEFSPAPQDGGSMDAAQPGDVSDYKTTRCPDENGGDGFFTAVFRRK